MLFFLFLQVVFAETKDTEFHMKVEFFEQQAKPGDVVTLKLSYVLPEAARIVDKPVVKGLEKLTVISTRFAFNEVTFKLMVDTLDNFEVPRLSLSFLDVNGKEQVMISDGTKLKVEKSLEGRADKPDIRPIKGIISIKRALWQKWQLYVLVALILLICFCVWRMIKTRRHKNEDALSIEPPDSIAINALEDLNRLRIFERGEVKAYYFSLSEIMRMYMEKIRSFPAYELTTEEIAAFIDDDEDRKLVKLLKEMDMVKFADAVPDLKRKDKHWLQAREYIENTRRANKIHTALYHFSAMK
jgi:hypothetical protein